MGSPPVVGECANRRPHGRPLGAAYGNLRGSAVKLPLFVTLLVIPAAFPPISSAQPAGGEPAELNEGPSAPASPLRLPDGITPQAAEAIERGLAFLARSQERRGSWSNRNGQGAYPVAMTALAGLALLMDGNTTTQGRYAPQVDRATNFLLRSVRPTGLITGGEEEARPMYGHGFSMLFLSQLYGMTEDPVRAQQIHDTLVRAVQLSARAQSRDGGWIYTPDGRSDEGSVTITQVQALRSCRSAGIAVPKEVINDAMEYLARSQNSDGGIRYSLRTPGGASRTPISAAAVLCWYNAGEYTHPRALKALEYCKSQIRPDGVQSGHDYYLHLYWSQALFVSSDPDWAGYFPKRRDQLLSEQRPDGSWFGDRVGDVYDTAVALIILQLPYQQLPIMQQ